MKSLYEPDNSPIYDKKISIVNFIPSVTYKNGHLSMSLDFKLINHSFKTQEDSTIALLIRIPNNSIFSELTLSSKMPVKTELEDNGFLSLNLPLPKLSPGEEFSLNLHVYYACKCDSPSYNFYSKLLISDSSSLLDSKEFGAILKL